MDSEVAVLKEKVSSLEDNYKQLRDMVDRHEIACEVHAPKAESAHTGVINMSKEIAVISETLLNVVNEFDKVNKKLDKVDTRNDNADLATQQILQQLAELKGEKRFAVWAVRVLFGSIFTTILWLAHEIQEIRIKDETHHHKTEKAITPSKQNGKIKTEKQKEGE